MARIELNKTTSVEPSKGACATMDSPCNEGVIPAQELVLPPGCAGARIGFNLSQEESMALPPRSCVQEIPRKDALKDTIRRDLGYESHCDGALRRDVCDVLWDIRRKLQGAVMDMDTYIREAGHDWAIIEHTKNWTDSIPLAQWEKRNLKDISRFLTNLAMDMEYLQLRHEVVRECLEERS